LACAGSIGLGLLLCFGLPVLAMLALVTVVGIPLGIGLLAALLLIYALGYSAAAQDEPALGGQGAPDGGRRTGPGELEDEVVAAAVPGEVLPGVVDHVVGTERPDQLQVPELFDDTADVAPEQQTEMLRRMAGTYPHITELVTAITHDQASVVGPGCDDQFEFALDLMLDGLERLKDRA
jgi:tetracycline repressor-like protein